MEWSAQQYQAFEAERTRPVWDLLGAVPTRDARRVVDLGCGPGNSTEVLKQRFPGADIHGLDNAPDMLAAARARLPGIRFDQADIMAWDDPGPYDAILANASLQWLPDHATLLPRLTTKLAPLGSLAVQVPDNQDEPALRILRDMAATPAWSGKLGTPRARLPTAPGYYGILRNHARRVDVWRTTYHHPLPGPDAIVDWFRATALRPILTPLDEPGRADFLAEYRTQIASAYPALPGGEVLLPFPRLFIVATA